LTVRLLAIDTSGDACSAALLIGSAVAQRLSCEPRRHGELILSMVEALLAEAGTGLAALDGIAFGRGPGSFTGVRIAAAVTQGLAFGADLPVVPVSTLAGLAQGHHRRRNVPRSLAAVDARMGELYWGAHLLDHERLMRLSGVEEVAPADRVELPTGDGWHGVGSGWAAYGDALGRRLAARVETVEADALCEARDIAALAAADLRAGRAVGPALALPVYLRDRVTTPPGRG
jgi:tRNA threonylcarbamoyladenosine biosynthesis protein TsaB